MLKSKTQGALSNRKVNPCPFCGEKDAIHIHNYEDPDRPQDTYFAIHCGHCLSYGPQAAVDEHLGLDEAGLKDLAANRWNRATAVVSGDTPS